MLLVATALLSAAFPLYFTRGRQLSSPVFILLGVLALLARGTP